MGYDYDLGLLEKLNSLLQVYKFRIEMLQDKIVIIIIIISFFAVLIGIATTTLFGSESQQSDQPQVTWKTFTGRDNLFTVQYPSNWTPDQVPVTEGLGPINIIFYSPDWDEESGADVWFVQYAQPSLFSTPQEALESEINTLQNDPTVTKFEIERPMECQMYALSGLPACSVIYEQQGPEIANQAILIVDALAPDGTEYEAYYHAAFDVFEYYLPTAEGMIESLQVKGNNSGNTDFSLRDGGFSNTTSTTPNISTNLSRPPEASSFSVYEDPVGGYRIDYPTNSEIEEVAAGTHFSNSQDGWSFGVLSSDHDGRDLNDVVQGVADFERELGFNVIDSSRSLDIAGIPAQMITKEWQEEQLRQWNIFMIKDDRLYEFQVKAPVNTFSSYTDLFYGMLQSFEFTAAG